MRNRIIWRLGEKPTGRYRSFSQRSWPTGTWKSPEGPMAAKMADVENVGYHPSVAENSHLKVWIAKHHEVGAGFDWLLLKTRPYGVVEAKRLVEKFYADHPEMIPAKKIRDMGN